jgi:hypothetical protein
MTSGFSRRDQLHEVSQCTKKCNACVTVRASVDYLHVLDRHLVKEKNKLFTYSGHLPSLIKPELTVH